jgi:hypothetical protein
MFSSRGRALQKTNTTSFIHDLIKGRNFAGDNNTSIRWCKLITGFKNDKLLVGPGYRRSNGLAGQPLHSHLPCWGSKGKNSSGETGLDSREICALPCLAGEISLLCTAIHILLVHWGTHCLAVSLPQNGRYMWQSFRIGIQNFGRHCSSVE